MHQQMAQKKFAENLPGRTNEFNSLEIPRTSGPREITTEFSILRMESSFGGQTLTTYSSPNYTKNVPKYLTTIQKLF